MAFRPPTLADERARAPGEPFLFRCPRCKRRTTPDMAVRTPATPATHVCDACRQRELRAGLYTREQMTSFRGAPAAAVARARRMDEHRQGQRRA